MIDDATNHAMRLARPRNGFNGDGCDRKVKVRRWSLVRISHEGAVKPVKVLVRK